MENCKSLRFLDLLTSDNSFINAITDTYRALIIKYPTHIKNKLEKFEKGVGLQFIRGLKQEKFGTSFRNLLSHKMNEKMIEEINPTIKELELSDGETLRYFDVLYNPIKAPNSMNYALFMISKKENEKYNILVVEVKNLSNTVPKVEFVRISKSFFGGIFSSEKEKVIELLKLKELEYENLLSILNYYEIIALRAAANNFGVVLDFPNLY